MIERSLRHELNGGDVEFNFEPHGLQVTLRIPLDAAIIRRASSQEAL
jgi:hypothetical protein